MPVLFFHPPEMDIRIFESRLLSAITGLDVNVDELWKTGERIWNLRRAIMVLRENRHKDDDTLCPDMFEELIKVQQPEILPEPLDRVQWEALKDRYYELRGWNVDNGWPTRGKLEELGMKDVADKLQSADKLG
jgi:aldehyde:ferredoxin oxidoreductase